MHILNNPFIQLIARLTVGFVFLAFSLDKIVEPAEFAKSMTNYQILPSFLINISSLILPWVELLIGVFLIVGVRLKASSLISTGLLSIFIIAVAIAWAKGLDINCGCSATKPQSVGLPKILENTAMLVLSIIIYYFPNSKFTFERFLKKEN